MTTRGILFPLDDKPNRVLSAAGGKAIDIPVFNQAHFSNPGTTRATTQFGRISSTAVPPREIQLGLKFSF